MQINFKKITILVVAGVVLGGGAFARSNKTNMYIPAIWVDPDGCEHWVMDDGVEGYMTPNVTRDGIPVCQRKSLCLVENSDQLFAVGSAIIMTRSRQGLEDFFRGQRSAKYLISGHTDSDGSNLYNIALGQRRADAVAAIARSVGAEAESRSYGEMVPLADNSTLSGKAQNRRVEVQCVGEINSNKYDGGS